jgi:serine/threonine protein kinase
VVGRTLSHYRILEKLGEGGMGVVYKAHDTHLDRTVAVKVLPSAKVADANRKQRFIREAKSASALNHPNIVTIHEIRTDGDTDFIVMEHVEGRTLDKLLVAAPLRPAQVLKFAVQIAGALTRAHAAGIVHRDLKPSNIMVADDGRVKVLDFGLAKLIERAHTSPDDTTVTAGSITEEGTAVGTAAYMSPEQAEGRKLDGRSDIFSFGAVLYQMATGRRPFSGDSTISILAKILNEDPTPPAQITASTPPELEKIILRCLRKDPERRYQTMADLKVALEDALLESSTGARVQPVPMQRRWAWAALAAIVLLAGYAAWRAWRPPPAGEPFRATTLTTFAGIERSPSLSPDGNHVVFTWTGPKQDNENIYVQQIGSGSPLQLTTDLADDYNPVWSPDGKLIAFLRSHGTAPTGRRDRELRLIPPLGGSERKLADVSSQDFYPYGTYLAWSPDSKSLVVTDSPGEGKPDALFVISIETGEKRQLTSPQPPALADTSPALSSDGRWLAFVHRKTLTSGELHVLALGNGLSIAGESKRLTSAELRAEYPTWMPDGREIVFSAKDGLWRLGVSGADTPARIPYVGEDGLMPAVSRPEPGKPARMVYVRSFVDFNFWRIDTSAAGAPSRSAPVPAISSTKLEYHIRFSPDGRRVAFTSARSGDTEIWLSDPDGSNTFQLTSMAARETMCPSWSPDGRFIAFSSDAEGEFDIYMVPVASGKPRRLTSHPAIDICPVFSRDGKSLYFASMRSGDYRVWKMPASGGDPTQISSNQGGQGAFELPDGTLIYNSLSTVASVWRASSSGGAPVKLVDGVLWFNYSVLDKGMYYIDRVRSETRLQYLNFASGNSTTVARNLGEIGAGLTASPDGRTVLFTRMDSSADDLMLVENFR